jgi:glycosyltransferase involved in cell wall biosynthesis
MAETAVPLVSILIPTYNRSHLLRKALCSALEQEYPNIEVIVSDNASTDDTEALLQQLRGERLRSVRQSTNIGMYPNWNACLGLARGEYALVLSDDDILEPTAIRELVYGISGRDTVGMIYSPPMIIDAAGRTLSYGMAAPELEPASSLIVEMLRHRRSIAPSGVLVRTDDLISGGGFDGERFGVVADIGAWLPIVWRRGEAAAVNKPLVGYRRHDHNETLTSDVGKWGRSFWALGDLCFDEFVKRGDGRMARRARDLSRRNGRIYMTAAILKSFRAGASRRATLGQCWQWRTYYSSAGGVRGLIRIVAELALPRVVVRHARRRYSKELAPRRADA